MTWWMAVYPEIGVEVGAISVNAASARLCFMPDSPISAVSSQPTRGRYGVVAFAGSLAMITYLDRACLGALAPAISADLSLSKEQMSLVFSAFALAYALFEIPTAWWVDRVGPRRVLTRIVLWWSAFTIATGAACNLTALVITRFLFGAGEAGAWPGVARAFARWVPLKERGRVQGLFFSGAHLSAGLTPMLALPLSGVIGWRGVFCCCGLIGVVWAAAWWRWFRDDPSQHPAVNLAEQALIAAGRESIPTTTDAGWPYWRRLLMHRNTLPLCLGYVPNSFAFYFCITWLPTYLKEKHGFTSLSLEDFSPAFRCSPPLPVICSGAWRPTGPRGASVCAWGGRVFVAWAIYSRARP